MSSNASPARWQWIPLLLVSSGVVTVWGAAFAFRGPLGHWQWLIYAGGAVALLSVCWMRRQLRADEQRAARVSAELADLRAELSRRQRVLAETEKQTEKVLRDAALRLDRREQDFARRLIAYQQWLELPPSLDLTDASALDDEQLAELARKDRQMIALLQEKSEQFFDKIRRNEYSIDGIFQPLRLRDDAYELIHQVARIYQPDVQHPVLETSVAQILQAGSRACLHFIAVLDRLPLDVKQQNLNSLYRYVRQAVNAVGTYKQIARYFPYFNAAYRVSRIAMGANPLSMGAWWLGTEFGKRGATTLVSKVVNRQIVILLHDLVRVIGFEVAHIYGGDFRHRDANWIYGTELTELISRQPISPEAVSRGLLEISALQLRNEYDRIYLYRALAEHRSGNPERYRAAVLLTAQERQNIAERLERFASSLPRGRKPAELQSWQNDVEERLHVKLQLDKRRQASSADQQRHSALRSLAGFLVEVRQLEQDDLPGVLQTCSVLQPWTASERQQLLAEVAANPPFFFEQPNVDPNGPTAQLYLQDLTQLASGIPPRSQAVDQLVVESGMYLRRTEQGMRQMLDDSYLSQLRERLGRVALPRRSNADVARLLLDLIEPNETPQFLFRGVAIQQPTADYPRDSIWLFGSDRRAVAFTSSETPKVVWRADERVAVRCGGGMLNHHCRLTGGTWIGDPSQTAVLLVYSPAFASPVAASKAGGGVDKHLQPLVDYFASRGDGDHS